MSCKDPDCVKMVDVGEKPDSRRWARACVRVKAPASVREAIQQRRVPKGNVLALAKTAGILAAKQCSSLLPLCHPIPLDWVDVHTQWDGDDLVIECTTKNVAKTGVEMEAMMGAAVTALSVYDACKILGEDITIERLELLEKGKEPA